MEKKTYRSINLLTLNYYKLRCSSNGYSTEEYFVEETTTDSSVGRTFTLEVSSERCYDILQKVFHEFNS